MTDVSAVQARVTDGAEAPDFTLPTDGGGSVALSALKGKPVVVYFYPKDDTSDAPSRPSASPRQKPISTRSA